MKNVNKFIVTTALAVTLGSIHSRPSEALTCQAIGAQACLDLLDRAVNQQSFVEAWATNNFNNYVTRNCPGGPSSSGTYTFYGRGVNKAADIVDKLLPNVSCNECDALTRVSGTVDGYLGVCSPSNDASWTFVGYFCGPPTGGGDFLYRTGLSLYDAAILFIGCSTLTGPNGKVLTEVSACSSSASACLD